MSLLAGSPHGGKLAKAMLGANMQSAHAQYWLSIMVRTFVDDAVIRAEGTVAVATDALISAGGYLGQMLQNEAGLIVSDKTVVKGWTVFLFLVAEVDDAQCEGDCEEA